MDLTSRSLLLAAALTLLRVSSAQNSTANNPCAKFSEWDNGFNATGSVALPGPKPNDSYPDTTWTWSRYITDNYVSSSNTTDLWQTVGLKTSPPQNLSDPSLPYTGCIFIVTGYNTAAMKDSSTDSGDCSTVFKDDCLEEIRSSIQSSASSYSGTSAGSVDHFRCSTIFSSITFGQNTSSKCSDNLLLEMISTQFLNNNFTSPSNPVCPLLNPGDSDASNENRSFFSWSSDSSTPDNYTIYDMAVTSRLPVFVATWLKSASNDTTIGALEPGNDWADTQIFCLPANETQTGSRNFTEAQNSQKGAAGKVNGLGMGVLGVAGLTVLFGLWL